MEQQQLRSEGLYPQSRPVEPWVRELALAILAQAFRDATRESRPSDRRNRSDWQKDAREWFFSEATGTGSLWWICAVLGLDQAAIRRYLQTHLRKQHSGVVVGWFPIRRRPEIEN